VVSVGIVGGDLGGLVLALSAARTGLETTLYAMNAPVRPHDLVDLPPNAMRILRALGLDAAIVAQAARPVARHLRSHRTGTLLALTPLGDFAAMRYGAPFLRIDRRAFTRLLHDAARSSGVSIEPEAPELEHVRIVHTALAVDLYGSHAIGETAAEDDPHFIAWSSPVAMPVGRAPAVDTTWIGPFGQLALLAGPPGQEGELRALLRATPDSPRSRAEWAAWFEHWAAPVRALIERAGPGIVQHIVDREPRVGWSSANVVRLGGACHSVLPVLDQDPALAIEDAWVLARLLDTWEEDVASAFADYERYRRPRVVQAQRFAAARARMWHEPRTLLRWRRNAALYLRSRLLPEPAMRDLDWLYEYDCIRGFD
jgi:salicylate hydroxylase